MSESRKSGQYPPSEFQTQPRTDLHVSSVLVSSIGILETVHNTYRSGLSLKFEGGILSTFRRFRHKLLSFKDSFPR